MRALVAAAFIAGFLTFAPAAAAQTPNPLTCEGYAEKRQFVEAQSWWTEPGLTTRHAHVGACIPERETLQGTVVMDVRMLLHNLEGGEFSTLKIIVKGDGYEDDLFVRDYELDCSEHQCVLWQHFEFDVSEFNYSGLQEMRLRFTDEEGRTPSRSSATMKPSMGWKVWVENGKTRRDYNRNPWLRGKGWYSDNGYCVADKVNALEDAPVSGMWSPTLQMVHHEQTDDNPVARHAMFVDPDFHADVSGAVLRDAFGPFGPAPFAIDTTRFTDGRHRLVLRADCPADGGTALLQGLLVMPFDVANGSPSPEPTPPPAPTPEPTPAPSLVTVTSPAAGATVTGMVLLNASVPAGTTRVGYLVDGAEVAFDATASDFSEHWSSTRVANGQHVLVARATVNGQPVDSAPVTITVSN